MSDATSSFLNLPLRSESQARAAHELAEQERRRRLAHHGTAFCRRVLAGAFERVYQADGSYRLREIQSGAWLEDLPPTDLPARTEDRTSPLTTEPHPAPCPAALPPRRVDPPKPWRRRVVAARQFGYAAALRDLSRWISEAANSPRLDVDTLAAMNGQIAHLSRQAAITTISGGPDIP